MTMLTPAGRVLEAFDGVRGDARVVLGESLEMQHAPLLRALGSALCFGPRLAGMVIDRALSAARWDGSAALLDQLGDDEPWRTIREALSESLGAP